MRYMDDMRWAIEAVSAADAEIEGLSTALRARPPRLLETV